MNVLQGIRVVELGVWVAGPSAGGVLADWGADVIKLEPPEGDPMRRLFASIGYDPDLPNPPFALDNRGKRSVAVDLRQPDGKQVAEALLERADVFVTNLRPEALERLGLDPSSVTARHERLVYASITGYGLSGPDRHRPGYDVGAFWARSGMARLLTPPGQPPAGIRGGLGDHVTGMTTVAGILGALLERSRTGKGRIVETSLLRTGMYCVGWDLGIQLAFDKVERTRPRETARVPLVNSYEAADGRWFWLIGLEADRHFPGVARAIGRPELLEDERFRTARSRKENSAELIRILDEAFAGRSLDEWAERFDREDVWWAPAQTPAEVVRDPQAEAAGAFVEVPARHGSQSRRAIASPVTFHGEAFERTGPVPGLGEDTEAVLEELGYDGEQIEGLRKSGVVS